MPAFLNSDLSQLAHQLTLSPKRLRVEQLTGIETVLSLVTPDKTYPFDWVCYHITRYQKRGSEASASIPGKVLTADLVNMAEHISRKAAVPVSEFTEPYWTQEGAAKELCVSTKTLRRWRRRGLLGIRAVFEDGVSRLIFLRAGIERFRRQNTTLVTKAASFRQLSAEERDQIIRQAKELVGARRIRLHETARIIAAQTGRAIETIRYTLRRYDRAHKDAMLFTSASDPVLTDVQQAMWDARKNGASIEDLAHAYACDGAVVRRSLREIQLRLWKQVKVECVHHELFDAPNADALILDIAEPSGIAASPPPNDPDMPPYLRSLYLTPLLTQEQEADLFRRYNYTKYKLSRTLGAIRGFNATQDQVDAIAGLFATVDGYRSRIVQANLRLVVSIAKRHVGWSDQFFEVVSDGNMSLLRAVEKFDFARGYRFSTYASWAVMKNYARTIPEERYLAARFVTGQDEMLAAAPDTGLVEASDSDLARVREMIREGLAELSPREREVVTNHFGLFEPDGAAMTLEDLGRRYGVTKERVRQIEKRAMNKLRELLPSSLASVFATA